MHVSDMICVAPAFEMPQIRLHSVIVRRVLSHNRCCGVVPFISPSTSRSDPYDEGNAGAVIRSCDAFGVTVRHVAIPAVILTRRRTLANSQPPLFHHRLPRLAGGLVRPQRHRARHQPEAPVRTARAIHPRLERTPQKLSVCQPLGRKQVKAVHQGRPGCAKGRWISQRRDLLHGEECVYVWS